MKSKNASILLIAKPGYRRNSISTSLHSIPAVDLSIADGKSSGSQLLRTLNPSIILIESTSMNGADCRDFCQFIRRDFPQSQCYLLVDMDKINREISYEYFDGFIHTNRSAYEFVEAVKSLLIQPEKIDQAPVQATI